MGLTVFSAPKPFQGAIDLIQRNALRSWLALEGEVEVLLFGDELGISEAATAFGVRHMPPVDRNERGTPLVNSIFRGAQEYASHPVLCYVNADILLLPDLVPAVERVASAFDRFLIVGQRWDLAVTVSLETWPEAVSLLRDELAARGRPHPPAGSDYFVFPRRSFEGMPPFALGRAGWDNWMIYAARAAGMPVVDVTPSVTVIHQDHDYAHLPGGQPHYRLPESDQNLLLAGGREMIFTLADCTWLLQGGSLRRLGWVARGLPRALESALYLVLGPGQASRMVRVLFHPLESGRYYAGRLGRRVKRWLNERLGICDPAVEG